MYRLLKCIFAAVIAMTMLCGCTEIAEEIPLPNTETTAPEAQPYPVQAGSLLFEQAPETVGSLSPAVTEIICELGYGNKIIGISSYCNYPENISSKNKLGSAANPDVDAIIAAAPELLISMSPIAKKDITAIEAAGTRVWIIAPPSTAEEMYNCYYDIAAVFGGSIDCADVAENAVEPLKKAFADANGAIDSYVYVMSPDLAVASDATFAGNFFSHFGTNAAGDTEELSLSTEKLIELDPEWLIFPDYMSKYELSEETAVLSAVKNNRIIYLDENLMERIERPTSRLETAVFDVLSQIEAIENEVTASDSESEVTAESDTEEE
ncbi:MAG: ABC transporter substrate-binding protein [Oscillospiraceae bacterium]|nr:ABC transporter substrate-binding protein [Oscillospiraceae bacterium]